MNHVTADVDAGDVAKWQPCTYSATCSNIQTYVQKAECADRCLHQYKDDLRRKAEERRRSEARRRKEAEALQSSSSSSAVSASVLATIVAAVIAASKISW